jgi:beta-glucosidase
MTTPAHDFPEGFLWGTATSAYQIEGAVTEGGRSPSIWDTFSYTPGRTYRGETGDIAADHYHRLATDVALMEKLGINAYRFSIAWPRLIPTGTGAVNPEGVAFYRELAERLLQAGIKPMATLYHWDLPQVLQDQGGWLNPDSPQWFAGYATAAKEHLGDLISTWLTLNEPWCAAFLGHGSGEHAPGINDPGDSYVAAHHLMLAHHRAVRAMRETNRRHDDMIGIALNLIPAWPAGDTVEDRDAAEAVNAVHSWQFADAVFKGTYPELILEYHRRFGVSDRIDTAELAEIRQDIDYLGVNYYNVNRFRHEEGAQAMGEYPGTDGAVLTTPPGHLTDMGWGVDPDGLLWMLNRVVAGYPKLPLFICENGAAYPETIDGDGSIHDPLRISYLQKHLDMVAEALEAGIDLRGYFVWSLLDNYEWAEGYRMRFGLIRVDPDNCERTIRDSGYWYRDFIESTRS